MVLRIVTAVTILKPSVAQNGIHSGIQSSSCGADGTIPVFLICSNKPENTYVYLSTCVNCVELVSILCSVRVRIN